MSKEIQVREKRELQPRAEQTRPVPTFVPQVDICENEKQITLVADLPGVLSKDLKINLEDDVLTIEGSVSPWEGSKEEDVIREFEVGTFLRQFTVSQVIDRNRIEAKLTDGVLHLTLPKSQAAQPKRITIQTS